MTAAPGQSLGTIVALDADGFAGIQRSDQAVAAALLEQHNRLLLRTAASHDGSIVKTAEARTVLQFPTPADAVRFGLDLLRRPVAVDALEWRVGIHVGDASLADDVEVGWRLQARARSGSVCVSQQVQEQLVGKVVFSAQPAGDVTVPGRGLSVSALHLTAGRAAAFPVGPAAAGSLSGRGRKRSVAEELHA